MGENGHARYCVLCRMAVDGWSAFRGGTANRPPFMVHVEAVGSNVDRFACPNCDGFDRERHLHLYFDRLGLWSSIRKANVLHMAPEQHFAKAVLACEPSLYVQGDLFPSDPSIRKIDIENIGFDGSLFDFVICNHVLEHVSSPKSALREVHRVLKPGGRLVCQTPYAARLTRTFEEPLLQAPTDRRFLYGQEDHVRLFGLDIEQIIVSAGFGGRLVPHAELLQGIDPESAGVNEKEPFFDFVRL
jgi:SAM-dependent methyltransferase